jgi:hypothetical protein
LSDSELSRRCAVTGHPESVDEARVEVVVPHDSLASVVTALQDAHPYQEVAFDVFERLPSTSPNFGMGRVGLLESPMKQVLAQWRACARVSSAMSRVNRL